MFLLKQSTAATVQVGPFLDSTDGVTAETGLTIAQADVRLSKNGANIAQKNESSSCTHDELGMYTCSLDATDTATCGRLQLIVAESGALPVWHEFMVVPAHVYDGLIAGTDYLQTDAVQVEGSDATDQINAACDTALSDYGANTTTPPTAASIADAVWDEAASGHTSAGTFGEQCGTDIDAILADTNELQSDDIPGTLTTIDGKLDTIDNFIDTEVAAILEDTGTTLPATLATIEGKIDTVDGIVDSILTDTAEIGSAGAGLTAVPWNAAWNAEVQSECTDALDAYDPPTATELSSAISGLNDISAADVWDASSATLSLSFETMLDRLYRIANNKMTITNATGSMVLRNEADSANIASATNWVTDDDDNTERIAITWS